MLEQLKITESGIEKSFKVKILDFYTDQAESDYETFDCEKDMEQHIRGLEFRRNGCQMKLDQLASQSVDSIRETGGSKLGDDEISTTSSADRESKAKVWQCKFNIYNLKIKVIKEIFKQLHKKQYIPYGAVDPNSGVKQRKAVKHWNKAIEQNVQASIAQTLATKH